jgi:hypothetical protein
MAYDIKFNSIDSTGAVSGGSVDANLLQKRTAEAATVTFTPDNQPSGFVNDPTFGYISGSNYDSEGLASIPTVESTENVTPGETTETLDTADAGNEANDKFDINKALKRRSATFDEFKKQATVSNTTQNAGGAGAPGDVIRVSSLDGAKSDTEVILANSMRINSVISSLEYIHNYVNGIWVEGVDSGTFKDYLMDEANQLKEMVECNNEFCSAIEDYAQAVVAADKGGI